MHDGSRKPRLGKLIRREIGVLQSVSNVLIGFQNCQGIFRDFYRHLDAFIFRTEMRLLLHRWLLTWLRRGGDNVQKNEKCGNGCFLGDSHRPHRTSKSINPRSGFVPTSFTVTRSPTSSPLPPRTTMPSTW